MTRDELRGALQHPNVQAFLRVIREGESSQGPDAYRMMFGGGAFSSFADHPRQANSAAGLTSTAAGAYQFLSKTWDGLVAKYGFPDFSPECQDEAAVALIHGRGALQDLLRGDLSEVLDKCSWEWASLPPNRYGQSVMDPKRVYATYDKWLKPNTVVATPTAKEKKVDPFTLTALTALLSNIPTLIRTFGKGTKSEENAKLAEVLIPMATQAVGAVNEQDLVTKIKNDPSAVTTIDQAVKDNLWQLVEAGGGGIEGAREYNLKVADKPMWHQPAFVISVILLLFPLLLCIDVFMLHSDQYSSELRTQIVTAVLLTFGMVGGFWLGSSFTTSSTRGIGAERK